ncbi:helix-turn-helix domain-containing protein [Sutcliffiella horikoshii]|uniref:Helix-turn-helix domain-containing protein n=1 Tax=Sutcliffiella horikoshii TaxID=79883 RepID=A0A5D4T025_9BACI|nr:helix-turn-helix transcriptional regulator [Sutcliffiella horikoshii]TYS67614.1 helix-turn-helix domain-containing protein [Sutcliffiella horikoshii]
MIVGEIIRYYREKAGLTQSQLGEGICTTTHVSKIERGKTAYSEKIIALFSERLNIDIQEELAYLQKVKKLLRDWHNAIILRREKEIGLLKESVEESSIVHASKYAARYQLLIARYHLFRNEMELAYEIISKAEQEYPNMLAFDYNLYLHVKGIYYLASFNSEDHQKAISVLNQINIKEYGNKEYYFHLGTAYFLIDSKVMSFFYVDKALRHFQETNNYMQANRAEALMLLQLSGDLYSDFHYIVGRYKDLISNCEQYGLKENKGLLLNNLGYEYYNRGFFEEAKGYFEEALSLAEENSNSYLVRLYNFVDSCMEGNLAKKRVLQRLIKEGANKAKECRNTLHITLFKLLKFRVEEDYETYYSFMEEVALPQFYAGKHVPLRKRYGKLLFLHYVGSNKHEKATEVSLYI